MYFFLYPGKTSLLNILAGRARSHGRVSITSDVRLNNYAVDPTNLAVRKGIAFVAQDDSLQVTSTPREAIRFSAKLRLPRNTPETQIEVLVERMLSELGLTSCADTIVGGALIKGISGGERKVSCCVYRPPLSTIIVIVVIMIFFSHTYHLHMEFIAHQCGSGIGCQTGHGIVRTTFTGMTIDACVVCYLTTKIHFPSLSTSFLSPSLLSLPLSLSLSLSLSLYIYIYIYIYIYDKNRSSLGKRVLLNKDVIQFMERKQI